MAKHSLADYGVEKTESPKSNKGKYVALVIVVLLAATITFTVLWAQEISTDPNEGKADGSVQVCLKPSCVTAAESLNKAMNKFVNPCSDFYEFACGGWNRTEVIPDDKSRWQVFDILRRDLLRNLRGSLTVPKDAVLPVDSKLATATEKVQKYFQTCMNTEKIKMIGTQSLKEHLQSAYNGSKFVNWPFMGSVAAPATVAEFIPALRTARSFGNSLGIFPNSALPDPKNQSLNVINFDAGRFTLDRFTLLNETKQDVRDAYVRYGSEIMVLLRKRMSDTVIEMGEAELLFRKILNLEIELAKMTLSPEDSRNETKFQNPSTLANFAKAYTTKLGMTGAEWAYYFQSSWPAAESVIPVDTRINVREPAYYEGLMTQLFPEGDTNIDLYANYLGWKVIEPFINQLDDEFRQIYLRFNAVAQGVSAENPRAETCVDIVNAHFPNAVGSLYVRKFFRKEAKEELNIMIEYLLESFRNIIKTSYWMEEGTRRRALEKANKIVSRLAYDDYLMDNITRLDEEHKEFAAGDDYLKNYAAARLFGTQEEGKLFMKGNKPTDWITGPAIVNAFYSPNHNSISFPAGILQAPFLGDGYPSFWNFAAIGTVIGHEITHGFDDQGAQSDGDGVLIDWWDDESKKNFKESAKGIIEQYSNYNYLGVQLKGANNQGENIADNGGLKESYNAYQAYRTERLNGTEEPRLPGFETYTTDQMFYLSYAQVWCGDYRPQEMQLQVNRAHSPGRFRVIGPLQNSPQFAQAYRCAENTYMNPSVKYAVW